MHELVADSILMKGQFWIPVEIIQDFIHELRQFDFEIWTGYRCSDSFKKLASTAQKYLDAC